MLTNHPVAGPRFKQAARLPIEDVKRRKLLCLLAAYEDAGYEPSVRELAQRLRIRDIRTVDRLLEELRDDGLLFIRWAKWREQEARIRNRYTLRLDEHAA
jgi:DNA-binding transcriptional ArsR family regulator